MRNSNLLFDVRLFQGTMKAFRRAGGTLHPADPPGQIGIRAMGVRILLIAKEGRERDLYLAAARKLDVEVTVVSGFCRLDREAANRSYHGVMVDLHTKIKALKTHKDFVYGILGQFPLVQVKVDPKSGDIRAFHHRQQQGGTLEDFIRRECVPFVPRRFRFHRRKTVHLAAKLYPDPAPEAAGAERTVTMNLSRGGCFVFTAGPWQEGQKCRMIFPDLQDPSPISCIVRHVVKWGTYLRVPGIGVEFTGIGADQRNEIENRFLQLEKRSDDRREKT